MKDAVAILVAIAEIQIFEARKTTIVRLVPECLLCGPRAFVDFVDIISENPSHSVWEDKKLIVHAPQQARVRKVVAEREV